MNRMNVYTCLVGLMLVGSNVCSAQATYSEKDGKMSVISGKQMISGVYPHLTTYAHARSNGQYKFGDECGIGALAVWGGKLYMVNYAAHMPKGSEHQLYILDKDKKMTIYPGSVGGTPAARMIHEESEQLLIGHYLIDKKGNIRTIPILTMPGRITAIARHLEDPVNKVYYYDMEGMLYEADVHTLEVKKLYNNPLPGWHGKGAYTAQGKLVLANNGEAGESSKEWQVPVQGLTGPEKYGVLAEYDGKIFKVVERKQFTDVTTRYGIQAVPNDNSPLWSMGWDKRAVRLKVMEDGKWTTFLLPKAAYNNDPSHGWFTEWPRIREVGTDKMMMDMHGMFFDFPATFSSGNSAGIRPIASHLRYIPDFCSWNGQVVLATDETSIQGNPLAGQPQSNLWFGSAEEFYNWGPSTGYGAIWLDDKVEEGSISEPYLFAGFARRMAHLVNHKTTPVSFIIQIDKKGNSQWSDYKTIRLKGGEYQTYVFPKDIKGEWIRLKALNDGQLSFILHYTTNRYQDAETFKTMFEGLAEIRTSKEILTAKLFSNRSNLNLSCFTAIQKNGEVSENGKFELNKFKFDFVPGITESLAERALETKVHYAETMQFNAKTVDKKLMKQLWSVDDASVILYTSVGNLRLPKGDSAYDKHVNSRCIREVESERELANIHGTFYELPLIHVGREPLFMMMRPVSSHHKFIDDYNSWNGLLVMSGIERDAKKSEHIYKNKNKTAGLWFGSIDDLWKLGKPVGTGGPWKHTSVSKDVLSDPYLMTGYDKKTLILRADKDVTVTLWVNISHYLEQKLAYKEFNLKADEEVKYVFPEGFSAHWAYLSADNDCVATGQFIYE
ncbi:hypothetical protein [Bacteroides sp. GM023]|uniref:hypothetical protein n=1 Tax=Bacteroides sp. GM023 TaxID=2723058 RepID=UPI00168B23C0|nr:hypothetical protein [Bacteroides sp. GM023]MBD3588510.1 hypothetical protein [Bacteroides sp. GM023]